MKQLAALVRNLGFACLCLAGGNVEAVAPRAYVSTSGNDANVCSSPATPCRTFIGAIAQTTSGGEVVVLDSGTFGGGTISQAVTINAPAGVAALVATGMTVAAGPSDVVTIRGVSFVSPTPGSGIALGYTAGAALNVENCVFHGWGTGIVDIALGKLTVVDTTVRENAVWGIYLYQGGGSARATLERTRLLNNGTGLRVSSRSKATLKDCLVSGNDYAGVLAQPEDPAPAELNIENCVFTYNNYAIFASDGGFAGPEVRVANSTITDNGFGTYQTGLSAIYSRGNNTIEGNLGNVFGTLSTYTAK
jgi:hypothetical protein